MEWFEKLGNFLGGLWDRFTGVTAVREQNQANLKLAQYQKEVEEELYNKYRSPQAIMDQYQAAGLNPNLIYGSASAGISSSPHYNAPHIERYMSGQEKVNTALSALSQVLGLKQAMYQTEVAREASEQSAIKTLSDRVGLAEQEGDLRFKNMLYGTHIYHDEYDRRRKGRDPVIGVGDALDGFLGNYVTAYRSNQLNSLYKAQFQNVADYGVNATKDGLMIDEYFGSPSIRTRNATNYLQYDLKKEIGNMGQYGKLLISLLDLLK